MNAYTPTFNADGVEVDPYTLQGHHDAWENYIPGYYDDQGTYHLGYGYVSDDGTWCVVYGYYTREGEWVDTPEPVTEVPPAVVSDTTYYTEAYFEDMGGEVLEVAMIWRDQVLCVHSFTSPRDILVGTDPKRADFIYEHPSMPSPHALLRHEGTHYILTILPGMSGLIQHGEHLLTLDEAIAQGLAYPAALGHELRMDEHTGIKIDVADVCFVAHFTQEEVLAASPLNVDVAPAPYVFTSAAIHLCILALMMSAPQDALSIEMDAFGADDRFINLITRATQDDDETLEDVLEQRDDAPAGAHGGDEGKAGAEDAPDTGLRAAVKGPQDNTDLQLRRAEDTRVVMDAGAVALLQDIARSPFGSAADSIGADAIHALGNLDGPDPGAAAGQGGLGLADAGRGGPGSDESIGMSRSATCGKPPAPCTGRDGGFGLLINKNKGTVKPNLGDKRPPKIIVVTAPGLTSTGTLSKEIIRRVVRQHRNEIRYCYERELQKNTKLAGTVHVKFTISGTGRVLAALIGSSTVNNRTMESCITRKIQRWSFPEPQGGGIVRVNYPFKFSS